jgi:uncharacterized protein (DUF169 family)
MSEHNYDFSVLSDLNLEYPAVGIRFSPLPPDDLPRLNEKCTLCEMLAAAQKGENFYADKENHTCEAGLYVLGQGEINKPFIDGRYGAGLKIYSSTKAASRLYQHIPVLNPGLVDYLSFATVEQAEFRPDLIIIIANTEKTEIILRAFSYNTGGVWESRYTPAIGCSWIFVYPYKTGKMNYSITGMGHGMKRRKLFPPGRQIISIPSDLFPLMLSALGEMEWELPACKPDGDLFMKRLNESM